jgi:hypothetical protein
MPLPLVRRHLVLAERLGMLCRDDSLAGRRYYKNELAAIADADAARLLAAKAAGACGLEALVGAAAAAVIGGGEGVSACRCYAAR